MIRKIIILGLIALVAFIFYKKFLADTFEPFFKKYSGHVDFFQQKVPDLKIKE
ncbi:MAG: hypothetical protein V1830_05200 [Candidatus Omnitrophota bacterium]